MQVTGSSYVAEFIGVFFFVMAILASAGNPVVVGLTLGIIVFFTAGLSGGHINPAVSLAMTLNGGITGQQLVGYVVSQLLGAAGGYYTYKSVVPGM